MWWGKILAQGPDLGWTQRGMGFEERPGAGEGEPGARTPRPGELVSAGMLLLWLLGSALFSSSPANLHVKSLSCSLGLFPV